MVSKIMEDAVRETERQDVVSGIFKFSDKVPIHILVDIARFWAEMEPERLLSASIRGCGDNLNGIDFKYIFKGNSYHQEMHRFANKLRGRVGQHNLKGWSISSPTYVIK